ncbi:MAG: PAS domain S-box protein [Acidobacteria bacterium]|nr:PAS domain S-box protein [Acidobacteriota bacterium]
MNSFPVPLRYIATTLLSIILVSVGVFNLRDRIIWVEPTDGIFWIESDGLLKAAEIEAEGPGSRAGIQAGYKLFSINGQKISNLGQYSDLLTRSKPGNALRYVLATDGGNRDITIQLGLKSALGAKDWLRALLAFSHLGMGIFVLFRGDRLPRTFHFYLLCLASFVVYLYSYTTRLETLDWWVYWLSILAFLLLPALFIHFCLRFPTDAFINGRYVFLVYIPAFILGMTMLLWATGHLASLGLPRTARSSGLLDQVQLAYFSAGFVIGGGLLVKRRLEAGDITVRQQMKWISYGSLAGIVPFSLIYIMPTLMGVRAGFAMEASMLFLSLIPLSFGYALIRYRLMDVEAIARRSAAYFIASSLLLSLYLLLVLIVGKALQWVAPQADFWAICIGVVAIAFMFAPLRNSIQAWLDRKFFGDQFEHRSTLLHFARTLNSEINLVPLSRSILDRISKAFEIDKAAIFLSDQAHGGFYRLLNSLECDPSSHALLFSEDDLIDPRKDPVSHALMPGSGSLYAAGPVLLRDGLFYLQDLSVQGKRVGLIALGRLPKDRHFSTEDLDLLTVLAGYAAMALENASLYRSVETKALELQRLKTYTENIIESINVAVLALDLSGRITSCNRAFETLYNANRSQIVGSPVENMLQADLITSIQRAAGKAGWEIASPVNIYKQNLENRHGKRMIVNISMIPLTDPMGTNTGVLVVMDDISEKVQLEDQLLQAEKLSSIGLLAAGIAHEVNTPIAGISSYTQMLLKETPETDRRKKILEKIEKQTFRAAEIVSGLLNFSRLNNSEFKDLDINQLIEDSLALLSHQLELNSIRVDSQFDLSLPPVYGNMGKLQQVFVNLFLNARDAMPSGGDLAIQTGMHESMVIVDISDTGAGIPEENIRRIFDPFFTTKSIGKGTGLGLAVSYGIVQEHGGGIFVDSNSGRGTHFRIKLPTRLH